MSLLTNIQNFITAAGSTLKDVRASIHSSTSDAATAGAALNTTATTLVGAINEVGAIAGSAAVINDAAASGTTTYSGTKIDADIAAARASLVNAAPALLDTLDELAAALGDDANFAATMTSALALKADIANTFSVAQLGAGIDTHDFVADWTAAIS